MRAPSLFSLGTLLVLGVAGSGCHPHVALSAPDATAPAEERVQAFERLRGSSVHETHVTYVNEYGAATGAARLVDYAQLADGRRVYHAADILPVVAPQSAAAAAAERSQKASKRANTFAGIQWGMFGLGTTVMFEGAATADYGSTDLTGALLPIGIGGGMMLLAIVPGIISYLHRRTANDEKSTAFEFYNEGLAMRLNVCSDDKTLVPCESKVASGVPASDEPAAPTTATPKASAAPSGFAGFEFAMNAATAKSLCEGAGQAWQSSEKTASCGGPAQSIGLDGGVQLLGCGDEFCQILFVAEPEADALLSEVNGLKKALEESYGAPAESDSEVPDDCRDEFASCVDEQKAYVRYEWTFENGQLIVLTVGNKPDLASVGGVADRKLRLLYTRKPPVSASTGAARAL